MRKYPNVIILGLGSDIGCSLALSLLKRGSSIFGTYRTSLPDSLSSILPSSNTWKGPISDFSSESFRSWIHRLPPWSFFISAIGTQDPVGPFESVNTSEWVDGVASNSTYQLAALIDLLPYRSRNSIAPVLFFAGGGTNGVTPCYSAQTLGKITLIKACELLNDEISDINPIILGPGWVNTKIHQSTLNAPDLVPNNYNKTLEMLSNPDNLNSIENVVEHSLFLASQSKELVGGRNFSSVHDKFTEESLRKLYSIDPNFYRLRRSCNDLSS